ncbi:vigilin [Nephila pilipes]|uniref:RNA-directed DNA polymerase n=1 Tax=Nephila pilipes TaxID=299642 RepID=A0A8X6P2X0_NEPPI|nr:vigilin [Nephila pilipes]
MKLTNSGVEEPIHKQNHKFIIGKGGANIKKIRDETNTKIDLPAESAESDAIAIRGPKEDVMKAKKDLLEILNEKQFVVHTAEIKVNPEQLKFLIGKNGISIKMVRDKTGDRVIYSNENDDDKNRITIIGRKEEVEAAKNELNNLIAQLKDTAETTTEIDSKHHRCFLARSAEKMSNYYGGVTVSFLKIGSNNSKVVLKGNKDFLEPAKQRLHEIVEDFEAMVIVECIIAEEHHPTILGTRGSKCRLEEQPSPGQPSSVVSYRRSKPTSATCRRLWRQASYLAQFDFTTEHRPGKQNVIADHLSRFPTPPVCLVVTASYETEICAKQKRDDFCQYIFRLLKEKNPNKKTMSIICNYNIDNNTLVRIKDEKSKSVVVIPKAMREQTLICCHDDVGHMDAKKTFHNLKLRYWWPNMRKDCKAYVRSCHKCQIVYRRTANAYGLLQQLPIPSTPWEIVSADHIVCLPQTRNGNTNMLVQIDHATRYVIATPSASLAAHTVTDALYHNIILRYGPPSMYFSDRGTAFTARHTRRFLQKYGITQSTTPPYSPQANSIVERANGIIVSTLKKMIDQNPNKWDELQANASLAINTTKQNSTQKSPFY